METEMLLLPMAGHINRIFATKHDSRWITKTESAHNFYSWSFHHIIDMIPIFTIGELSHEDNLTSVLLFIYKDYV